MNESLTAILLSKTAILPSNSVTVWKFCAVCQSYPSRRENHQSAGAGSDQTLAAVIALNSVFSTFAAPKQKVQEPIYFTLATGQEWILTPDP